MSLGPHVLAIDAAAEARRVADFVADETKRVFRRDGVVVGLSGGIDSAVMCAIAVDALGQERVVGLILPEKESSPKSAEYAVRYAESLGIEHKTVDVTSTVETIGSYAWRDDFLKTLIPEYGEGWRYNIALPTDLLDRNSLSFYVLRAESPDGTVRTKRLGREAFRTITAFASIKIRARMVQLYWEAERRGLVVAGTTNRTELILGDFCKYGDGGTDLEALSHLYKNQIYQLGSHYDVMSEIMERAPSPDTFSLPVDDQAFFFRIPFDKLDHLLYAWEHDAPIDETAAALEVSEDGVKRAFKDFTAKNRATAHLREIAHTLEPL